MPMTRPAARTSVPGVRPAPARPAHVIVTAAVCFLLAALTATGALLFNLIGVDNAAALVKGILLIVWAAGYVAGAVGLLRGRNSARTLLISLLPLHLALNVSKVAGGETFSVLFLVLITTAGVGLFLPITSRWLRPSA